MDLLIDYALRFVGQPYIWGGSSPLIGFDCSGLVQELLASCGIDPPGDQTAQALYDWLQNTGKWNSYSAGSLAFYGQSATKVTHVAMLLDPYRIIEAGGGGSHCLTLADAKTQGAYVRIRLVKHRADLVAVIKPAYEKVGLL